MPRPDPIPGPPRAAIRRFSRALGLVALFALAVAVLALVLVSSADAEWRIHMMIATGVGIFLTVFLGGALMLLVFGARFAWKGTHRKQGLLMIVVAVILVANVLIWVL